MYLFLTPSKTDGGVNSQQGAPTTCNLTYWEVSQQPYVQTLLASLGVVKGQNSALKWRGGGRLTGNGSWPWNEIHPFSWGGPLFDKQHITAIKSRLQIPLDTQNCLSSTNLFLPRKYNFITNLQPKKIGLKNRVLE